MDSISNKMEIDRIYDQLSPRADLLYRFVMVYADYIYKFRDYGTGQIISMIEVHTLTMIEDNPGITVSKLATMWNRTKSAVSQTTAKLEDKKLIYRKKSDHNAKVMHLYPTETGIELSVKHKMYDNMDIMQTKQELLESCTLEEIDAFYKVLDAYCKLFE